MTRTGKIVAAKMGPLRLSEEGRKLVAANMYARGKMFIGAGMLLEREEDSEPAGYAVLHLYCQGVELLLKGLLLRKDYREYWPRLKREFGHKLLKLSDEVTRAYDWAPPEGALREELVSLGNLYERNILRYANPRNDFFHGPASIERKLVLEWAGRLMSRIEANGF